MSVRALPSKLFDKLSSSKLALVMVLLLILFSIVGAVLPQQGRIEFKDIALWQMAHPTITSMMRPLGFFHVFNSWPFIIVILLLGVNTLTCTLLRFVKEGGFPSLRGPGSVRRIGFFSLHLSLILLFAGGFLTSATRMKARIVLTEGQTFEDRHDNYLQLVEGPLRPERHTGTIVQLQKVQIKLEKKRYPIDVSSTLEFLSNENKAVQGVVKVNYPLTYKDLAFTQDKTGFSPRLVIRDKKSKRLLFNSFIALQTFDTSAGKVYRDFLTLPFLKQTFTVEVFPSFSMDNGQVTKAGDEPENPLLVIEMEDEAGKVTSQGNVPLGGRVTMEKYIFSFAELRRWSSFMVVEDPGYLPVCVALWLGLGALILRYVPDLKKWFGNGTVTRQTSE
jgi:cytochrome c biogenesis protein ResB